MLSAVGVPQLNRNKMNNQSFNTTWMHIYNELDKIHKQKIEFAKLKFAQEKENEKHYKRN